MFPRGGKSKEAKGSMKCTRDRRPHAKVAFEGVELAQTTPSAPGPCLLLGPCLPTQLLSPAVGSVTTRGLVDFYVQLSHGCLCNKLSPGQGMQSLLSSGPCLPPCECSPHMLSEGRSLQMRGPDAMPPWAAQRCAVKGGPAPPGEDEAEHPSTLRCTVLCNPLGDTIRWEQKSRPRKL